MALTLEKEQRLGAVGLIKFFDSGRQTWRDLAKKAYDYVRRTFPTDSRIRRDDVAKALEPIIEVSKKLRNYLNKNRLKQKYWIEDFTDLVIDRTWTDIRKGEVDEKKG